MRTEDLKRLFKGKTIKLGESDFEVRRFGVDQMPLLMEYQGEVSKLEKDKEGNPIPTKRLGDLTKEMIQVALRNGIEDATDSDKLDVPIDYAMKIFTAISDVHSELLGDTDKQALLDRLKK